MWPSGELSTHILIVSSPHQHIIVNLSYKSSFPHLDNQEIADKSYHAHGKLQSYFTILRIKKTSFIASFVFNKIIQFYSTKKKFLRTF